MSIKDYLVSERIKGGSASSFSINETMAHSMITATCLSYLLRIGGGLCFDKSTLRPFPLAVYAARYWVPHMRLGRDDESHIWKLMICMFSPEGNALADSVRLDNPDIWYSSDRGSHAGGSAETAQPLYYASSFCLKELVVELLCVGEDIQARGGTYDSALQAALCHGHRKIVQILLEHGAQAGEYGSAMPVAFKHGHLDLVRLLLENGVDINTLGEGDLGTALQNASFKGQEAVVQLLLENGADVNASGVEGKGTALRSASSKGQEAVVRLLLEHGADVNAPGRGFGTALQAASHHNYIGVVRLLLDQGADVDAPGEMYGTALQAASYHDSVEIVRLLLEHGADVNAPGKVYGTALQAALCWGRIASTRLLLENGADIGMIQGAEALHHARVMGLEDMVQLLLASGVADYKLERGKKGEEDSATGSEESDHDGLDSDSESDWYSAEDGCSAPASPVMSMM